MPDRGRRPSTARPRTSSASAYEAAVRYLGPRPRSVAEVRRHLAKKRHDRAEIDAALTRLREQGYLDDLAFARYWREQRARFRPKGRIALAAELRAKGVDASAIDEALEGSESDEVERARAALEPRLARWRALDPAERKAKAQAFLRQRGFSYDVVEEVLARI